MFVGQLTDEQTQRLRRAQKTGKYGGLFTWKELFVFQHTIAKPEQWHQIAEWARRYGRGEGIKLPLSLNPEQIRLEIMPDKKDEDLGIRTITREAKEEVPGGAATREEEDSGHSGIV